eukprot:TRINITY_DN15363_c1_g1_i1.p1 TRINITY_DN15363_c1_g1~~TRINITY_DN15363_c1_g1_i1.p1  ORF type:complete len:1175 (-),score=240.28 TRINITY_DN15363_c1_g1_i1:289-3756(-)
MNVLPQGHFGGPMLQQADESLKLLTPGRPEQHGWTVPSGAGTPLTQTQQMLQQDVHRRQQLFSPALQPMLGHMGQLSLQCGGSMPSAPSTRGSCPVVEPLASHHSAQNADPFVDGGLRGHYGALGSLALGLQPGSQGLLPSGQGTLHPDGLQGHLPPEGAAQHLLERTGSLEAELAERFQQTESEMNVQAKSILGLDRKLRHFGSRICALEASVAALKISVPEDPRSGSRSRGCSRTSSPERLEQERHAQQEAHQQWREQLEQDLQADLQRSLREQLQEATRTSEDQRAEQAQWLEQQLKRCLAKLERRHAEAQSSSFQARRAEAAKVADGLSGQLRDVQDELSRRMDRSERKLVEVATDLTGQVRDVHAEFSRRADGSEQSLQELHERLERFKGAEAARLESVIQECISEAMTACAPWTASASTAVDQQTWDVERRSYWDAMKSLEQRLARVEDDVVGVADATEAGKFATQEQFAGLGRKLNEYTVTTENCIGVVTVMQKRLSAYLDDVTAESRLAHDILDAAGLAPLDSLNSPGRSSKRPQRPGSQQCRLPGSGEFPDVSTASTLEDSLGSPESKKVSWDPRMEEMRIPREPIAVQVPREPVATARVSPTERRMNEDTGRIVCGHWTQEVADSFVSVDGTVAESAESFVLAECTDKQQERGGGLVGRPQARGRTATFGSGEEEWPTSPDWATRSKPDDLHSAAGACEDRCVGTPLVSNAAHGEESPLSSARQAQPPEGFDALRRGGKLAKRLEEPTDPLSLKLGLQKSATELKAGAFGSRPAALEVADSEKQVQCGGLQQETRTAIEADAAADHLQSPPSLSSAGTRRLGLRAQHGEQTEGPAVNRVTQHPAATRSSRFGTRHESGLTAPSSGMHLGVQPTGKESKPAASSQELVGEPDHTASTSVRSTSSSAVHWTQKRSDGEDKLEERGANRQGEEGHSLNGLLRQGDRGLQGTGKQLSDASEQGGDSPLSGKLSGKHSEDSSSEPAVTMTGHWMQGICSWDEARRRMREDRDARPLPCSPTEPEAKSCALMSPRARPGGGASHGGFPLDAMYASKAAEASPSKVAPRLEVSAAASRAGESDVAHGDFNAASPEPSNLMSPTSLFSTSSPAPSSSNRSSSSSSSSSDSSEEEEERGQQARQVAKTAGSADS